MKSNNHIDAHTLAELVSTGLAEDLAYGADVTSRATIATEHRSVGVIRPRQPGVVVGDAVPAEVMRQVATGPFHVEVLVDDGARVEPGQDIIRIEAVTLDLLAGERTMLNLMSHLSGIATHTAQWVDAIAGTQAQVRDSRKTLPGYRLLQKYAVSKGGGVNHRMGLGDAALIKDNHVAATGSVVAALEAVRKQYPDLLCEVEVDTFKQLEQILPLKPEAVLVDNFAPADVRRAVTLRDEVSPDTKIEASGRLSLEVAADYAATGVDYLAVGALTHSAPILDLGLDFIDA